MADALRAVFFFRECRPISWPGTTDSAMIEILFIYQLARNPLRAVARRWWCRSLFRASRGKRRCPECNDS
jgi:hypothetical protein